uniref:Uncharacterized protein n=1 Tax=Pyrodinium bahamense TaxID=73915 RepID=A0A7S0FRA9_9DINO
MVWVQASIVSSGGRDCGASLPRMAWPHGLAIAGLQHPHSRATSCGPVTETHYAPEPSVERGTCMQATHAGGDRAAAFAAPGGAGVGSLRTESCKRAASLRPVFLWSCKQSVLVATEGNEWRFLGKVRLLEAGLVGSVSRAVELFNRDVIRCPEGLCVVHSAKFRAYYLLFRRDKENEVAAVLKQIMEAPPQHMRFHRPAPPESVSVLPRDACALPADGAVARAPTSSGPTSPALGSLSTKAGACEQAPLAPPDTLKCQEVSPLSGSTHASASALSAPSSRASLSSAPTLAPPTACPSPSGRRLLPWGPHVAPPSPADLQAALAALAANGTSAPQAPLALPQRPPEGSVSAKAVEPDQLVGAEAAAPTVRARHLDEPASARAGARRPCLGTPGVLEHLSAAAMTARSAPDLSDPNRSRAPSRGPEALTLRPNPATTSADSDPRGEWAGASEQRHRQESLPAPWQGGTRKRSPERGQPCGEYSRILRVASPQRAGCIQDVAWATAQHFPAPKVPTLHHWVRRCRSPQCVHACAEPGTSRLCVEDVPAPLDTCTPLH